MQKNRELLMSNEYLNFISDRNDYVFISDILTLANLYFPSIVPTLNTYIKDSCKIRHEICLTLVQIVGEFDEELSIEVNFTNLKIDDLIRQSQIKGEFTNYLIKEAENYTFVKTK